MLNWEVTLKINTGVDVSRKAIEDFVKLVPGCNSLLAFIGHDIEVGDDNFFLPKDAACQAGACPAPGATPAPGAPREAGFLPNEFLAGCISFSDVQRAFSESRGDNPAEVTIFVLDCCRSPSSWTAAAVFAPTAPPPPRVEGTVLNSVVVWRCCAAGSRSTRCSCLASLCGLRCAAVDCRRGDRTCAAVVARWRFGGGTVAVRWWCGGVAAG